jgi:hypothetical protein
MQSPTPQRKGSSDQIQAAPEHDNRSVVDEKLEKVVQIGEIRVLGLDAEDEEFYVNFGEERRKKLVHRVCLSLLPIIQGMRDPRLT